MANALKNQKKQILDVAIKNEALLSNSMKNFDNGIEEQKIDNRSNYEKRLDSNFMRQEFEKKVYDLFNNDVAESTWYIDKYMNDFGAEAIPAFNNVFPQLKSMFKNSLQRPDFIFQTTLQLIENMADTGVIQQNQSANNKNFQEIIYVIQQFIDEQRQNKLINKHESETMGDLLEAMVQYANPQYEYNQFTNTEKWNTFKKDIQPTINNLIQIITSNKPDTYKMDDVLHIFKSIKDMLTKSIESLTPAQKASIKAFEQQNKAAANKEIAEAKKETAEAKKLTKKSNKEIQAIEKEAKKAPEKEAEKQAEKEAKKIAVARAKEIIPKEKLSKKDARTLTQKIYTDEKILKKNTKTL